MTVADPTAAAGGGAPVAGSSPSSGASLRERGTIRHDEVRARRWEVGGIAKVVRGVEVDVAQLRGTTVIGGPLVAREVTVSGGLESHGPVTVAGRFRVRGSLDTGGSVRAGAATFEGPVRIARELVVDGALRLRGALRAASVRCEQLRLRGSVTVPGALTSGTIDAELVGDCSVGAVVCREIRLRRPVATVVEKVLGRGTVAEVGRVEAERAWVGGARVGFLRAKEVVLGRDAHIASVEGRIVRAHPSSRVGPESWSRPPAGLSR